MTEKATEGMNITYEKTLEERKAMTDQSGWGKPAAASFGPASSELTANETETTETETSEVGMSKEEKEERKHDRQALKETCLSLAVDAHKIMGASSAEEVTETAGKFYSFINGTKFKATKKEI